ncbi:hypothetical protein [Nocardioides bigeumensis]|uniref:Uncharacterized protein n=1 Tax=Nocardioides bigeumensis TaxID=433657 RepID=A0ABN2XQ36_9ACTN
MTEKRRKHLIDPAAPRPQVDAAAADHALTQVQRWVISVLAVTTILHLAVGIVIGSFHIDDARTGDRVGLCVIGGLFGVVAVAAGRAIHGRSPVSLWLLLGTIPGLVGIWLTLR